jgi:DMSO/TMAO reductase YedYZ molybdopterin-dependent catalytic subunit
MASVGRLAGLALFATLAVASAAEPPPIAILHGDGSPKELSMPDLATLPEVTVHVTFATENGLMEADFAGPLLWTVLDRAGVIDPAKPRAQVRQGILVTGQDGYTAVLALAEIAPAFEAKQVILAETMNGKKLEPGHLRIIVPGDHRGGRSVRDVTRIAVMDIK